MFATIRRVIDQEANLVIPASSLMSRTNLYDLGLTAFDAVRLLLAIERAFKVEFPPERLKRGSVGSIEAIGQAVTTLQQLAASETIRRAA